MKPFISLYTLYLGFKIFQNSVLKKTNVKYPKKKANFKTLGVFGGFIDSFTGGGWCLWLPVHLSKMVIHQDM